MQLATWTTGSDSIGWSSLPHDNRWCITPPPFGRQCTLLRPVAMLACISMPWCVALTCPDPAESHIGRKAGVTGPICQARSVRTANEKHHGMCRPGGCLNIIRAPSSSVLAAGRGLGRGRGRGESIIARPASSVCLPRTGGLTTTETPDAKPGPDRSCRFWVTLTVAGADCTAARLSTY